MASRQRHTAARVRQMLQLQAPPKLDQPLDFVVPPLATTDAESTPSIEPLICPHCQGRLIFIRMLTPRQAMAPSSTAPIFAKTVRSCYRMLRHATVPLVSGAIERTSFAGDGVAARPETAASGIGGSARAKVQSLLGWHRQHARHALRVKSP